jgi:hypothetical protein
VKPVPTNPPDIVRPAEDLAALAHAINAEHGAGEAAARKGLEHFRAAGEKLLKAKAQCGHGKWLPWLKANVHFDRRTATNYMNLARIPADKWETVSQMGMREALRVLADDGPAEEEAGDLVTVTIHPVHVPPLPPTPTARPAPPPSSSQPLATPAPESRPPTVAGAKIFQAPPTVSVQDEIEMLAVRFKAAISDVAAKWATHFASHTLANQIRDFIDGAAHRLSKSRDRGKGTK